MSRKVHDSFLDGISSTLSLFPSRRSNLTFVYGGRDLERETTAGAMRRDWEVIGGDLFNAIAAADSDDEREREREQYCDE